MMPDMDGMEVCRRLRADPQLAEIPIIMVTALDDDDSRMQGIEAGADDFISKPFDRMELRARIRTIMRLNRYRRIATERAQRQQAEERTRRQLQRLSILHDIDIDLATNLDLTTALQTLVKQLPARLGLDAVAVSLHNAANNMMEHAASHGFRSDIITRSGPHISEEHTRHARRNRSPIYVANLHDTATPPDATPTPTSLSGNLLRSDVRPSHTCSRAVQIMQHEGFVSYYAVPLISRGEAKGVLEIFHTAAIAPEQDWLDFLETLAGQAAIALDNAELFETLQQSYEATLVGWVKALDLRDKETEGHSQRVTEMSVRLAQEMGFSDIDIEHTRRGALLHDIGKLGIPDSILLKPGPLTDEEWIIMRKHPVFAHEWLSPIEYLRPALDIPYCHHEKWDGTGYPRGLHGENIPLAARIFAVIDVWDALTSDRPYRKGWPEEKVRDYILEQTGKHFDPAVVEVFLALIGQGDRHAA
jgi:response regulator RpfG family c-di-GMP phosphodiesterase